MHTPAEPTAALAALIAGNQRHMDRRATGRAPTVSTRIPSPSARPFVVAVELERLSDALPELFDVSPEQVRSFVLAPGSGDIRSGRFEVMVESEVALARLIDGSLDALGAPLVIVIGRLRRHSSTVEIAFRSVEDRCFGVLRQLLVESVGLVAAIQTGRIRVIGAIVDERDGRIHWLGEHPDQSMLLTASR